MYEGCKTLEILLTVAMLVMLLCRNRPAELAPFDKNRTLPIRGVLALLVVIGHCDTKLPGSHLLQTLHMSTPAVAVFFFLSGYGLVKSLARKPAEYLNGFLPRSLVKFAVPMLVASLAMCVCLKFEGRAVGLPHRLENLVLYGKNFPQHSWFVYALAIHYAFFCVSFRWLLRTKALLAFAALSACYFVLVRWGLHWPTVWWRTSLCMSVGVAWSLYEDRIRAVVARRGWAIYGCMLAVLLLWHVSSRSNASFAPFLKNNTKEIVYLFMGPSLALVMYVLRGIPRPVVSLFSFLGTISFEIYLLHFIGERNLVRLGFTSISGCLAVIAFTVLIAYPVHKFDAWAVRSICGLLPQRKGSQP